ncbi:hypothetical protein H70357_26275 [Paenibacillus sp. FSL H7-0357]|nr:hypothetical protein H70357_26275 [Paenibacillus sp. FSL H7-0357]
MGILTQVGDKNQEPSGSFFASRCSMRLYGEMRSKSAFEFAACGLYGAMRGKYAIESAVCGQFGEM